MRLTSMDDTDLKVDGNGQPIVDHNGNCVTCTGLECWMQDIWTEMLTEERELLHEDQDGRMAFGYGLSEFLNAEVDDFFREEIQARIIEKLTKRSYINESSIKVVVQPVTDKKWAAHVQFTISDKEKEFNIDITSDGTGVYIS